LEAMAQERILREKESQDLQLIEENKTQLEENAKNLYVLQEQLLTYWNKDYLIKNCQRMSLVK